MQAHRSDQALCHRGDPGEMGEVSKQIGRRKAEAEAEAYRVKKDNSSMPLRDLR